MTPVLNALVLLQSRRSAARAKTAETLFESIAVAITLLVFDKHEKRSRYVLPSHRAKERDAWSKKAKQQPPSKMKESC